MLQIMYKRVRGNVLSRAAVSFLFKSNRRKALKTTRGLFLPQALMKPYAYNVPKGIIIDRNLSLLSVPKNNLLHFFSNSKSKLLLLKIAQKRRTKNCSRMQGNDQPMQH